MSDNKTVKYLKRGLLVSLFATTSISSMAQSQTFEEYRKAKTEQFNKIRQQKKAETDSYRAQKKAEMDQYLRERGMQSKKDTDNNVRAERAPAEKTDGLEVYLTGLAGSIMGLGLDDIRCQVSKDGSFYYFLSSKGVAVLNPEGQGLGGVWEKDGKVHYYKYDDKKQKKEEVNDVKTKELVGKINESIGDKNSDFSKSLAGQKVDVQKMQEKPRQSVEIKADWVVDRYGMRANVQPDQTIMASALLPNKTYYNSKNKQYSIGYVRHFREQAARTFAKLEIQRLAAEENVYQDLKKRADTEKLDSNAQRFLREHPQRMDKMGLYVGKDGKLHQKDNNDTSQVKGKTLDLTSYFIAQNVNSQS